MKVTDFTIGQRVITIQLVAPHPMGTFPEGTCGTVTEVFPNASPGLPIAIVLLDRHFADLNGWDNQLQVFRSEEGGSDIDETLFEQFLEKGPIPPRFSPLEWRAIRAALEYAVEGVNGFADTKIGKAAETALRRLRDPDHDR
jgi:hypothetical protein